jgi:hypothetical protein
MTCSTTSRKRRRQSSQGGDNLDMEGHLEMEGSRCNVIMKKTCICRIWNISTDSFHLYFVMIINFFYRWIENGCTSVIEWANVLSRDWKLFWRLLQNTRSRKICLMFTTYVAHALIDVMRKRLYEWIYLLDEARWICNALIFKKNRIL